MISLWLLGNAPPKDCPNCQHRAEEWRDGGHCYMFREEPEGDKCAQFRPKEPTR